MCGINGIYSFTPAAPPIDRDELHRTRDAMIARGPDAAGTWVSPDGRVGLAARRLAIQDLSAAGDQPMADDSGRVQVVLNGEIYNFRELRSELEGAGHRFHGRSDTEVVLALYLRHGEALLPRLRGMFALAIWDGRDRRLLLARDRFGIKPLYYSLGPSGWPLLSGSLGSAGTAAGGQLRFASQVKALEAGGAVSREVDPAGLAGFLLWGSVPEPWTIRRAIRALPAGHLLVVEEGRAGEPRQFAGLGGAQDLRRTAAQAPLVGEPTPQAEPRQMGLSVVAAISESVKAHLVSDVPVAVFLSGGLDSSLVTVLVHRHLFPERFKTFTVSFDVLKGTPLDEAQLAYVVAQKLGIAKSDPEDNDHIESRMGHEEFTRLWPDALKAMDQPSIDGFNTFVISRAAHEKGLKVVLSGLGGDELLGSYPSFAEVPLLMRAARWGRRVPGLEAVWPTLARLSPGRPKLLGLLQYGATLPGAYFLRRALFLPEELQALMGPDAAAAGLGEYNPFADAGKVLADTEAVSFSRRDGAPDGAANGHRPLDPWLAVHLMESSQYLRNQLLRDADWASMACSVELRVPLVDALLDTRLAAAGYAPARRIVKKELERLLAPEVPAAVWNRRKHGFYIPILEWLRPGELGRAGRHLGARSRTLAKLILAEGFGITLPGTPPPVPAGESRARRGPAPPRQGEQATP